jgi:hypothetical protein
VSSMRLSDEVDDDSPEMDGGIEETDVSTEVLKAAAELLTLCRSAIRLIDREPDEAVQIQTGV